MEKIGENFIVRTVLNSQGGLSIEAEVHVKGGKGLATVPRALVPGRRERSLTEDLSLGEARKDTQLEEVLRLLRTRRFENQQDFDALFRKNGPFFDLGSDISLALSLAFCRAQADASNQSLQECLSDLAGSTPSMPYPIVNIFSGGVHGGKIPFQQLMIVPRSNILSDNLTAAVSVFGEVEKYIKARDCLTGYSASSGMLTTLSDLHQLLDIVASTVERMGLSNVVALGTDVAAEHLEARDNHYRLHPDQSPVSLDDLAIFHRQLLRDYNFCFFEDPFGPDEEMHWRQLTAHAKPGTIIVGDDLFATNADNIEPGLANGILLKMNQVGTVSGTLEAAEKALALGMRLCVSHRSKETEDTAICDLAVAIGADMIKIGGPRRGDRIAKYNQLLRLSEKSSVSFGNAHAFRQHHARQTELVN